MTKSIVLGGGCFWCIEAVFQRVQGVSSVESGYAGGDLKNPTYHNHGNHAEVVRMHFDENQITLTQILDIFFHVHNPTTINRQGNDVGTQYRSIVLYGNSDDESIVRDAIKSAQPDWDQEIVTEVAKLDAFYRAEDYHQDYYNQNQTNPYCQAVINPKLTKFHERFNKLVKTD